MNREQLTAELIRDEGLMLTPYRCESGALTIGIGRNLDDLGITEDEALYLLANDIARVERELDDRLPWWRHLPEQPQRALVNMAFNLGLSRLSGFKKMLGALTEATEARLAGADQLAAAWLNRAADEALNSRWAEQVGARAERIAKLMRPA